jgi:amino acid permease
MENRKLSLFEAASVVAGLGVGGGIMAVPYLASVNGVFTLVLILAVSYGLSLLLHLMITEMVMRDKEGTQLVETFGKFMFQKRGRVFFTWIFFGLVVLNFYALLAAFIVGAGDLLVNLTSMPPWSAKLIVYVCAASPVFFGLKALGISEKLAIAGILVLVGALVVGSLNRPFNSLNLVSGSINSALALYGMVMFAFACFFSIPQAVKGLQHNKKLVAKAVSLGIGINLLLVFVITLMTMLVSENVTEMAIIGWGNAIGQWAIVLGSCFVFLAILTSYWSTSYALAIVLEERLKWDYRICWLTATLPTLVLAMAGLSGFLGFMRLAGGLLAVMISIMVIPAFLGSRKYGTIKDPEFKLNRLGHPVFQGLIILAYILVVVGSVVTVP